MKKILSDYGIITDFDNEYQWRLNNFIDCCKNSGEYITSPKFSFYNKSQTDWQLKLYPHGNQQENKDYLSLYIESLNNFKVKLKCQFIIQTKDDTSIKEIYEVLVPRESKGFDHFFEKQKLFDCIETRNNVCYLFFRIDEVNTFSDLFTCMQMEIAKGKALQNLSNLLNNENFCDVTIIVSGKEFRACKAILAAQSPIFEAMFTHDMVEKETNMIEIKDVKPEVFEYLLTFIYTAEIKKDEKIIKDLLTAADKYAMDELKCLCGLIIFETIDTSNACEILVIADLNNEDKLKGLTIEFIVNNARDVVRKPEFQMLKNTSTETVMELFSKLALSQE